MKRKIMLRSKVSKTDISKNVTIYTRYATNSIYQMTREKRNALSEMEETETDDLIRKINRTTNMLLKRRYLEE